MTIALKYCKAAPAIAMSYLSIVWGLLGGYFFFHEVSHCRGRQDTGFEGITWPQPSACTRSSSRELLCMPFSPFAIAGVHLSHCEVVKTLEAGEISQLSLWEQRCWEQGPPPDL